MSYESLIKWADYKDRHNKEIKRWARNIEKHQEENPEW